MSTALDRKRINGPEVSVIPLPLESEAVDSNAPILGANGKRADGRDPENVRPLFMRTGVNPQADGSAFVEQGNLKIVCAVYGPRPDRKIIDPDKGRLTVDYRIATFAEPKRRPFQKGAEEKEFSELVLSALTPAVWLESFPKSSVDVYISVLDNDGSHAAVAAAITAASLALADAGVEMHDLVSGCSAGFADDVIIMDMTLAEEKRRKGSVLLAYMSSVNQVSQLIQSGESSQELSDETMDFCIDACAEIHTLMSECLVAAASEEKPN